MSRRRALIVLGATATAVLAPLSAFAFWALTSDAAASGYAKAGAIGAPSISASAVNSSKVTVTVTAAPAAPSPTPTSYRVERTAPTVNSSVCTITAGPTMSCDDNSPVPGASNTYKVVGIYGSWEATNANSPTTSVNVPSIAATKFAFTSGAVSGTASAAATLGPITVQRQDASGNPVTAGVTTVNLSSNTSGTATFAATLGGTAVTSLTIPNGSSVATFYYGDTKAGAPVITASGSLTSATQTESISAATASKVAFKTSPLSVAASATANNPVTLELEDAFGNAVNAGSAVSVALSSNSTGTAKFSATSGGGSTASVSIGASASTVTFYYADTKAGSPVITANPTGYAAVTQTETISAATATQYSLTGPAGNLTAGTGSTVTLTALDTWNNIDTSWNSSVVFTGAGNAPAGTGAPAGQNAPVYPAVTFSSGVATPSITLVKAESNFTLTATTGAVSGSATLTVVAGTVSNLAWTSLAGSAGGTASAPCYFTCTYTGVGSNKNLTGKVTVTDSWGNPVARPAGSPLTVTLTNTAGGGSFPGTTTTVTVAGSASESGSFTFNLDSGNSFTDSFKATATGFAQASMTLIR